MRYSRNRAVGLLGGSFNPAHAGHRFISVEMMKRLGLDEVWWLVSPQNPLKQKNDMADYATRLEYARGIAAHPRIRVSDVEKKRGLCYTIDTLLYLTRRYPSIRFVWLMGSDSLTCFHRWKKWQKIAEIVPIAVWDRGEDFPRVLRCKTAERLARFRRNYRELISNAPAALPAWAYLRGRKHGLSATFLRETRGKKAFNNV